MFCILHVLDTTSYDSEGKATLSLAEHGKFCLWYLSFDSEILTSITKRFLQLVIGLCLIQYLKKFVVSQIKPKKLAVY
jgi:hypothetical protein